MNEDFITKTADFERRLRVFFDDKKALYPERLRAAMEYSLFGGGKRIRPLLVRLSAEFLEISWPKTADFAVAIELIHTYSLIHDDLPCMDDSDERRGAPSCHKKFDEATAVLAGDALLNLAYETLFSAVAADNKLFSSAVIIAESAGAAGMVGGQAEDIAAAACSEEDMLSMYEKKTASLIRAAALAPAYLFKNEPVFQTLSQYGVKLGILFQLTDDMLDNDKLSYPACFGAERAKALADSLLSDIKRLLDKYGAKAAPLLELAETVAARTK